MRSLVLCSENTGTNDSYGEVALKVGSFTLEKNRVACTLMEIDPPAFDPEVQVHQVLLRVLAFSCNYRDKSLILAWSSLAAHRIQEDPEAEFYSGIGSEFVAEVLAVGKAVTSLAVGDRVIQDAAYPLRRDGQAPGGLSTNRASLRQLILPAQQLLRIPPDFPIEIAAGLTIAGQTVFGMLHRLQLPPKAKVLVTAAKSMTSLLAISALKDQEVYALSSSLRFQDRILALGAKSLWQVHHGSSEFFQGEAVQVLNQVLEESGGFDAVIDPFIDLHLDQLLAYLKVNGQYITCGFYQQYPAWEKEAFHFPAAKTPDIFGQLIKQKVNLYGHCLGRSADLQDALSAIQNQTLTLPIDSVFEEENPEGFFERTYNAKDRFGKVIFRYRD